VEASIEFMEKNNWKDVSKKCHDIVLSNAERFYSLLGTKPISPLTSEWIGQMISIPINTSEPEVLQRKLYLDYKIEIPVMRQENDVYMRYSINAFNTVTDLDTLYQALEVIKKETLLIK
jgi:isopenicillin-N epimerase